MNAALHAQDGAAPSSGRRVPLLPDRRRHAAGGVARRTKRRLRRNCAATRSAFPPTRSKRHAKRNCTPAGPTEKRPTRTASKRSCARRSLADAPFFRDACAFTAQLAPVAAIHGLAQVALKLGAPGVPDIYQGCELWDFSLVDPDNRRAVDYDHRREVLASFARRDAGRETLAAELLQQLARRADQALRHVAPAAATARAPGGVSQRRLPAAGRVRPRRGFDRGVRARFDRIRRAATVPPALERRTTTAVRRRADRVRTAERGVSQRPRRPHPHL